MLTWKFNCRNTSIIIISIILIIYFNESWVKITVQQLLRDKLLYISYLLTNNNSSLLLKDPLHSASSVWCVKRLDASRMCNFKNLYYLPQFRDHFVFLLNEHSIISGIESVSMLKKINLSTVKNHTKCNMKLLMLSSNELIVREEIRVIDKNILLIKRFKPDNIMHVLHDDLLPLFITYNELCLGDIEYCLSNYQLFFLDDFEKGSYLEWYLLFSYHSPIFVKDVNIGLCIKHSIAGLSQESVWFDYGFVNVQGPSSNSLFNGIYLRKFSKFIKQKLGIQDSKNFPPDNKSISVVFLNRAVNRKILNGDLIKTYINRIYKHSTNVKILEMDVSSNSSKSLVHALHYSNILIGMHGSAMILTIFMKEESNIIELFPFGIQPEFVSPVKALCALPNVHYNYSYWVNMNESNSVTHPEYEPLHGGVRHLPLQEQEDIKDTKLVPPVKCCHNPVYLYRMFQDTFVEDSLYSLLNNILSPNTSGSNTNNYNAVTKNIIYNQWYFPPQVFNLECICINRELKLIWNFPLDLLSNISFSIFINNGIGFTTIKTHINIPISECKNSSFSVWVKTLQDSKESLDSYKQCIQ